MENTENNVFNSLNTEDAVQEAEPSVQPAEAEQNNAENVQNTTPVNVPPAMSGQYPPQYYPGVYNAPYYTAPSTPYNQGYTQPQQMTQSPAEIYKNTCQGTAPQYHYGVPVNPGFNNAYYQEQQEKFMQKKKAEKKIRRIGNISGALLIACMIVAFFFSVSLFIPSISNLYDSGLSGQSFINMIYTLVVVGGTYLLFAKFFRQHGIQQAAENGGVDAYSFKTKYSAPKNPLKTFLLIMISFGGCMLANYVSSIILTALETVGLYSTYSSLEEPKNVADIVLMVISVAIVPALVEEFALRGVLLSNLRRYGNAFAIVASAFIFGIFHGDVAQIPFAFICGLFFAYAVIATDSLWTGIIIHAMNNALSCISSVLMQVADEETANAFFYLVSVGGILIGIICVFIYVAMYKGGMLRQNASPYDVAVTRKLSEVFNSPISAEDDSVLAYKGDANEFTAGQKIAKFLTSPVMIAAIILYLLQSLTTLSFQ